MAYVMAMEIHPPLVINHQSLITTNMLDSNKHSRQFPTVVMLYSRSRRRKHLKPEAGMQASKRKTAEHLNASVWSEPVTILARDVERAGKFCVIEPASSHDHGSQKKIIFRRNHTGESWHR